jgi:trypsin-like peptidase
MRFGVRFYILLIAMALIGPGYAQNTDDTFKVYAVHIDRTQQEPLHGYGVYLGNGFVITAAHVIGGGDATKPQLRIAGQYLPTKVVKDGNLNDVDLTLLSVEVQHLPESLAQLHLPLCQTPHGTGTPVVVATPDGVARSYIMSPTLLPPHLPAKFRTVIRYVAETGNSGAGVIEANEKCLLGIISRKITVDQVKSVDGRRVIEPTDIAKYFVPASEIAKFIPSNVRF